MTDTNSIYNQLGVSDQVLRFGQEVLEGLTDQFRHIDQVAEFNQAKVIAAMQKNRVNATHFNLSTGYGYDDEGRDNLERVYADCFGTEAALVRPQITCGTHALALALALASARASFSAQPAAPRARTHTTAKPAAARRSPR